MGYCPFCIVTEWLGSWARRWARRARAGGRSGRAGRAQAGLLGAQAGAGALGWACVGL